MIKNFLKNCYNFYCFTHSARHNFLVDLNGLIREKGRVARRHLVHQHSQRPPVHSLVVALHKHTQL